MLFMVIERFRDPHAVHNRFAEKGRMLPEGVTYHASWIDPEQQRCFQVMEAAEAGQLEPWTRQWDDLMAFEIIPVVPSSEYWTTALK